MLFSLVLLLELALLENAVFALVIDLSPSLGLAGNLTDYILECYDPYLPRLNPTNVQDCRVIANGIMSLLPHGRPWVLNTKPGPKVDYLLPLGLMHRSCQVRVVPLEPDSQAGDTFTARYFAHQVNKAINKCVIPWPHRGGEGEIGPKKVLGLLVSGILDPTDVDMSNKLVITQGHTPGTTKVSQVHLSTNFTSQS